MAALLLLKVACAVYKISNNSILKKQKFCKLLHSIDYRNVVTERATKTGGLAHDASHFSESPKMCALLSEFAFLPPYRLLFL